MTAPNVNTDPVTTSRELDYGPTVTNPNWTPMHTVVARQMVNMVNACFNRQSGEVAVAQQVEVSQNAATS